MKKSTTSLFLAYMTTLTFSATQMVLYVTIPYITDKTGLSMSTLLGAIGAGSFIFAFTGPFWSSRSDQIGRARILRLGLLGPFLSFGLLSLLFIFNDELSLFQKGLLIYACRIIYGLLASATLPVSQAWQLDIIKGQGKVKILTKNSMCLNLGKILGPCLVLFYSKGNFEYFFYAFTIWMGLLFILVNFQKTPVLTHKALPSLQEFYKEQIPMWKSLIKEAMAPLLLAFLFTAFIGIIHTFMGHYIKGKLGLTGPQAGAMMAQIVLVICLGALLFQQLGLVLFKDNWRPRVLLGPLGMVIGSLVLQKASTPEHIWISSLFLAIGVALIPPAYLALTSETRKKENVFGKKIALAQVSHSLGNAFGMGLMALSLKQNLISQSSVIVIISVMMLALICTMVSDKTSAKVVSPA